MKTQFHESADLLDMLLFTAKVIATSEPGDKQRIRQRLSGCALTRGDDRPGRRRIGAAAYRRLFRAVQRLQGRR